MRKLISLMIIVIMSLAIFSGCSKKEDTPSYTNISFQKITDSEVPYAVERVAEYKALRDMQYGRKGKIISSW
nr:hypothetical protein [Desulforamulus aquiferis]